MPSTAPPARPRRPGARPPARPAAPARSHRRRSRIVVLGDLDARRRPRPAVALESGHGRAGPRLAGPGRLGGEHRALARPARGALEPHRVGRAGCAPAGPSSTRSAATASRPGSSRVAGARTGRIGVVVAPGGERSFVADRGAADLLRPDGPPGGLVRAAPTPLHLPVYSLLGEPLGLRRAVARSTSRASAGAAVSVDLASIGPLLAARPAGGARAHRRRRAGPPVRDGRRGAGASSAARSVDGPARVAPDRGRQARAEGRDRPGPRSAPSRLALRGRHRAPSPPADTTGAGDAFDAGFLVGWFAARARGSVRCRPRSSARAVAGTGPPARQLSTPRARAAARLTHPPYARRTDRADRLDSTPRSRPPSPKGGPSSRSSRR